MVKHRCSEDSYDAIYICSCEKMQCSKHYFSHLKNFPKHKIERIKNSVNDESRQILINFIISIKEMLVLYYDKSRKWVIKNSESYENFLRVYNDYHTRLNFVLLFLIKVKSIPMKLIFTSFEYFLHQPSETVIKFVNSFKFPETFEEFIESPFEIHLFDFNYFIFEEQRYIFGWNYDQSLNEETLPNICLYVLLTSLGTREYEMALESLGNLIIIEMLADKERANFLKIFFQPLHHFIKNRNVSVLVNQWKNFETVVEISNYILFYTILGNLFYGLNDIKLVSYCFKKIEILDHKHNIEFEVLFYYNSGMHYSLYEDYKKAKKAYWKFIRLSKDSSDNTKEIIDSYFYLLSYYIDYKKYRKAEKIIKIVKNIIESCTNTHKFDAEILEFYYKIDDLDKALITSLKLIKSLEEKNIKTSLDLAFYYLRAGQIYIKKRNFKKAHRALCNAKSRVGNQPMGNLLNVSIYKELGNYYILTFCYKDAIEYYERIISYCRGKDLGDAKFGIGVSNYAMENYDKALQCCIEAKDCYFSSPNKFKLFNTYAIIGSIYERKICSEEANCFYTKAFELINYLEINTWEESVLFNSLYTFFYNKCDYDKCKAFLEMKTNLLSNNSDIVLKCELFIEWSTLFFEQNKILEADEYLYKAEKLMNLEKTLLMSKSKINLNSVNNFLMISTIYIRQKSNFSKAEEICKTIESTLDINSPTHLIMCYHVYANLQEIYIEQENWIKAKEYNQKLLNLLKEINQNEFLRQKMLNNKAELEDLISAVQWIAGVINSSMQKPNKSRINIWLYLLLPIQLNKLEIYKTLLNLIKIYLLDWCKCEFLRLCHQSVPDNKAKKRGSYNNKKKKILTLLCVNLSSRLFSVESFALWWTTPFLNTYGWGLNEHTKENEVPKSLFFAFKEFIEYTSQPSW